MSTPGKPEPEKNTLTVYQHVDPEKHFIGETLLAPSVVRGLGGIATVGTSPIVAREDHVHGNYYATTSARDLAIPTPVLGQLVTVGIVGGTLAGANQPRYYIWDGSGWQVIGWWSVTGRIGCYVNSASTAIPAGGTIGPNWVSESYDYDNMVTGGNTAETKIAGLYVITSADVYSTSTGSTCSTTININGSGVAAVNGPAPFGLNTVTHLAFLPVGATVASASFCAAAISVTKHLHMAWIGP